MNGVHRSRNRLAVFIGNREGYERKVFSVAGNCGTVGSEQKLACGAGGFYGIGCPGFAVFVGHDAELAGFRISHRPNANGIQKSLSTFGPTICRSGTARLRRRRCKRGPP